MSYDPRNPSSIFEPGNALQFMKDITTMHNVRMGYPTTDAQIAAVANPGAAMVLLAAADKEIARHE